MTQDQFVELLTNWLRANKQFSANLQISPDTELLGSGLLDSFDFLDLIVHIESKMAAKIDLSVADPNQFSTVRGLWNLAMSAQGGAEHRQTDRGKHTACRRRHLTALGRAACAVQRINPLKPQLLPSVASTHIDP